VAADKRNRETVPWLWPALVILVGIVLLLDNFLLLGDFNAVALLPLLLVVAGAQILLRGDLLPSAEGRTFGVTRGSVESATLEISAGGIDVDVRPIQREGRLIAGQYAAHSRPSLSVKDTYTHVRMDRAATPWYSFADWQVALAKDLPWQVLISTHLGQIDLDLSEVIVYEAVIASGVGDIRLVAPPEALKPLVVRSTLGNVHIITPEGHRVRVIVDGGRLFNARHDIHRYAEVEPSVFEALDAHEDAPLVEVRVSGTFGDAYLA
jgi:hypothetical protein